MAIPGALVTCSNVDTVWEVGPEDAIGTWILKRPGVITEAKLVIEDDGTFVASNWPRNLACDALPGSGQGAWGHATKTEDIDWEQTVSIDGLWDTFENFRVSLDAGEYGCSDVPQLWKTDNSDSSLELRFYLNGIDDEWNFVSFSKARD